MKGVDHATANRVSCIDFLKCLASNEPGRVSFYAIRRHLTSKEVVTVCQERIAINGLSFKLRMISPFNTEALF